MLKIKEKYQSLKNNSDKSPNTPIKSWNFKIKSEMYKSNKTNSPKNYKTPKIKLDGANLKVKTPMNKPLMPKSALSKKD